MVNTLTMMIARKPGLTFQQFQDHVENVHVPLLKSLAGDTFPIAHTRYYTQRNEKDEAVTFVGKPELVNFDCYAQLTFRDNQHQGNFFATMMAPETYAKLQEDDAKFSDGNAFRNLPVSGPFETRA
ncbi:MAG: hypothetical protein Q9162_000116 [Coniocarpon cinnabarinum]